GSRQLSHPRHHRSRHTVDPGRRPLVGGGVRCSQPHRRPAAAGLRPEGSPMTSTAAVEIQEARPLPRARPRVGDAQFWLVVLSLGWLSSLALLFLLRSVITVDPGAIDAVNRLARPLSPGHILGSDQLGRDLLARVVYGMPYSLAFGLVPTVLATVI